VRAQAFHPRFTSFHFFTIFQKTVCERACAVYESDRFKYEMCGISNTVIEIYNIMFEMDNGGGSL